MVFGQDHRGCVYAYCRSRETGSSLKSGAIIRVIIQIGRGYPGPDGALAAKG